MATPTGLQPCPECERHVRASERACPFCGHLLAIVAGPPRWTIALLGLCLAACTSSNDAPQESEQVPAKPARTPAVDQPQPQPDEPTTAIAPPPELLLPEAAAGETGEASETTGAEQGETGSAGTTDGAAVDESPTLRREPKPTEKHRPAKTYGGPPKPLKPFSP